MLPSAGGTVVAGSHGRPRLAPDGGSYALGMYLAGAHVQPRLVPELIRRLREARCDLTAEKVERGLGVRTVGVALGNSDRDALLRVLEDKPAEFAELREALLAEVVARKRGSSA